MTRLWAAGSRLIVLALALALPLLAASFEANAQQVGQATNLRVVAMQTPRGNRQAELLRFSPIYLNALLTTSPKGALEVTFSDGSRLSLGGSSNVVVDQYVYSGPGNVGQQTVRYTKGFF